MAAALFEGVLKNKAGADVVPSAALDGAEYVGIYFSAHWCGPCRSFTPQLNAWYDRHAAAKKFVVVFASLDKEQAAFDEYFKSMSWPLALPFGSPLAKSLSAKYKVQGIPTLVILDARTGALVTADGREGVDDDEDGAAFPYRQKSAWELLESAGPLLSADDAKSPAGALRDLDAVGLYFSAHWCPPCRGFTPQLAAWYEARVASPGGALHGKVELVFVSSDRDDKAFDEYRKTMPWKSLARNEAAKRGLSSLFKVQGIPTLVFIDKAGNVLTSAGREKVLAAPDGFPWPPPAFSSIDDAVELINDIPTAVLFTDKLTSEEAETASIAAFSSVAEELFAANGGKPLGALRFAVARESDEAVGPVRKFLGPAFLGAKDGPEAVSLVIVDVSNAKKYVWGGGGVPTADACRTFVQAFLAGTLNGIGARE